MGPATEETRNLTVSDLLIPGTSKWNQTLIQRILPAYEGQILGIKVSKSKQQDKRTWCKSPNGQYTAKSGYHVALQSRTETTLNRMQQEVNWNKEIWQVPTAPKVKTFLWKAIKNAIPSGENLRSRNIQVEGKCIRCGEWESTYHILFKCPYARKLWELAPLTPESDTEESSSVLEGIRRMSKRKALPPTGIQNTNLVTWICWNLWISRNQLQFKQRTFSERETLTKSCREAREWQEAQKEIETKNGNHESHQDKIKGTGDQEREGITCKSDAAWNEERKLAGLGRIWDLGDGIEQIQQAEVEENVLSPLIAESLSLRNAIFEARERKWRRILLKSDCLKLIQAIKNKSWPPEIHGICSDIDEASSTFESCKFMFVRRNEIIAVDELAKMTLMMYQTKQLH